MYAEDFVEPETGGCQSPKPGANEDADNQYEADDGE